jgi:hypothetical protein
MTTMKAIMTNNNNKNEPNIFMALVVCILVLWVVILCTLILDTSVSDRYAASTLK